MEDQNQPGQTENKRPTREEHAAAAAAFGKILSDIKAKRRKVQEAETE